MSGDLSQANSIAEELNKKRPADTQMQSLWLPAIRGQIALDRMDPNAAIENLRAAVPTIEYGQFQFTTNLSCLYHTYIRGQAYLAAGRDQQQRRSSRRFSITRRHRLELLDRSVSTSRRGACECAGAVGHKARMQTSPVAARSLHTKTSSPYGRTLSRMCPSSKRQRQSTRSCNSPSLLFPLISTLSKLGVPGCPYSPNSVRKRTSVRERACIRPSRATNPLC